MLTGTRILSPVDGSSLIAGTNLGAGTLPCQWIDPDGLTPAACADYGYQRDPRGAHVRYIQLYDQSFTPPAGTFSDSDIAGGAGDDVLFGQLGDDWIQGDGSVIDDAGRITIDVQTRDTVTDRRSSAEDAAGPGSDGDDYVEGNGGADVIYGDLGQDDLVGGSFDLFGLVTRDQRPDGADTIYGGAGTRTALNDPGDLSAAGHAHDADVIMGDNGDIYRLVGTSGSATRDAYGRAKPALAFLTFTYDTGTEKIVPRSYSSLDYTVGVAASTDIGASRSDPRRRR
ncbi:hypothetical protein [Microbacterium elymi]|uniref:Calcium-binding protein n=1 Tax=Microbacterium elymi TaxID=2909587 RepID=A0ABY5NN09_9MICO|nr:hypothetical protein [Microbacterium elymi]UUT36535.1 hypothetical protein L2X98_22190 [Microbacterium elymi]